MERLVTVKDISERYSVSMKTARSYIRQMFHYEKPLTAPEWAFREWERSREKMPECRATRRVEINYLKNMGRAIVPRKRG